MSLGSPLRKLLVATVAGFCVGGGISGAHAMLDDAPEPPTRMVVSGDDDSDVRRALRIVRMTPGPTTWRRGHDANVRVATVSRFERETTAGLMTNHGDRRTVEVRGSVEQRRWFVLVHEFAHAAGIEHGEEPCSIMNPVVSECALVHAFTVEGFAALHDDPRWLECVWTPRERAAWARGTRENGFSCEVPDRLRRESVASERE